MIVPLIKKLRSILSNKRHCLKQAFQERTLTYLKDASEMHPCRMGIETGDCSTLCALCPPLGLCVLHAEIKRELNKQKYYKN